MGKRFFRLLFTVCFSDIASRSLVITYRGLSVSVKKMDCLVSVKGCDCLVCVPESGVIICQTQSEWSST